MNQQQKNTLFYGDNLPILREYIADESVDLVYLDPPFNSSRTYNVLFKEESGKESEAQITAFDDTWHWNQTAEQTYQELATSGSPQVANMIGALRQFIGTNQMMAYLVMMAARLVELHRVLKPTGSLYLHCDPTASHYLKMLMDAVFGSKNFHNDIIWHYSGWNKKLADHFESRTDNLLFYSKGPLPTFNSFARPWQNVEEYVAVRKQKVREDASGRAYVLSDAGGGKRVERWLDEAMMTGGYVDNVWNIPKLNNSSKERLGYPTQKPLALLERIIEASSNPGDFVLDPFCGCGTTIAAAEKLGRHWIGIDITHLSIALQKYRLKDSFGLVEKKDYAVIGEPEDLSSAQQLAHDDRYQFQWWALSLIKARPIGDTGSKQGKKGSDKGIDGVITFIDEANGKIQRVLVQVKSGHVSSRDIRDLVGTIDREGAAMAVFITLESPSKDMLSEAVSTAFYHSPGWEKDYPKLQILTIADLLNGAEVKMPPTSVTFKQAERIKPSANQESLF